MQDSGHRTPLGERKRGSHLGSTVQSRTDAGDLYARVGDYGQALSTYLAVWPKASADETLGLARRIGYCQSHLGRFGEVIALLGPIVEELPEVTLLPAEQRLEAGRCWSELGNAYLAAGEMDSAQTAGLRAVESLQGTRTADLGIVQNLLGAVALQSGDIDLARTHFRSALEHFRGIGDVGNLAFAYNNLGHVYKRSCEWERALEHYQAAYYLRATEGEYQDQGAFHQNLGVAFMKVGRYDSAKEHLDQSLQRAIELGDSARAFRARLALSILGRVTVDASLYRTQIEECKKAVANGIPERELCLLRIEDARIALLEGRFGHVREQLDPIRRQVADYSPQGELVVEVLLLQASLALEEEAWDEAKEAIDRSLELALSEHDREQENRARAALMRWAFATGDSDEGNTLYEVQTRRYSNRGERPAEAWLHEWRAAAALRDREPQVAFDCLEKAAQLWSRMSVSRMGVVLGLRQALAFIDLGQVDQARHLYETFRDRATAGDTRIAQIAEEVARKLESTEHARPNSSLEGERVLVRLQELVGWDGEPVEKLRAALLLFVEAVHSDGAILATVEEGALEIVSSVSMGRLGGRRTLTPSQLSIEDLGRAHLLEFPIEDAVASAMVLPVRIHGRNRIVYLERREGSRRYQRAELNYAALLVHELARTLPRSQRAAANEEPEELQMIRHGLHVADIITQDPKMLEILSLIRKVGDSDLNILLQGETGTGKKLLAQAIHRVSSRRERPFVTVDCAALPDSLLESELFGHCKGAFTGATQDRIGLLEEANGGTIFLDEIDKAGLTVQRRFLHLLDSQEIRPVGSTGYRALDVRVVCATSCPDLRTHVADGKFIKDLYYRLNDIAIQIPALRDRPDDIELLMDCFLERMQKEFRRDCPDVSASFRDTIRAHDWPGNVRELEKAVRRAIALAEDGAVLGPELLPSAVRDEERKLEASVGGRLKDRIEQLERRILIETLDKRRWNKSQAAAELGLSRKGLKGKLERYQIDRRKGR